MKQLKVHLTHWGRDTDDTFKRIFLNENARISIKMSLKFVPKDPINNIPTLVEIMAWCLVINQWSLCYWRIYSLLGLSELTHWSQNDRRVVNNGLKSIFWNKIVYILIQIVSRLKIVFWLMFGSTGPFDNKAPFTRGRDLRATFERQEKWLGRSVVAQT